VRANGITIAYESFGPADRETILLIQGQGAQLTAWPVELCEELVKRGYQVVIYDNRDVGLSTKFDSAGMPDMEAIMKARAEGKPAPMPYTINDMAKDAVGLLDALGIKKAHLVGVSMGGMIAQLVAADYPEHTLSLTSIMSISGNPAIPFPAKPEVMAKLSSAPEGDTEGIVARGVQLVRVLAGPAYPPDEQRMRQVILRSLKRSNDRAGMERHRAAAAVGIFEDRRPKLKTIKVPTIVIHGTEDPIFPVEGGKDVAANIPGAELHIIPNMGHDLPIPLVKTIADDITKTAFRAGL
jgi:pimeloyl-ACP methyl ester carboxylesterase